MKGSWIKIKQQLKWFYRETRDRVLDTVTNTDTVQISTLKLNTFIPFLPVFSALLPKLPTTKHYGMCFLHIPLLIYSQENENGAKNQAESRWSKTSLSVWSVSAAVLSNIESYHFGKSTCIKFLYTFTNDFILCIFLNNTRAGH